MSRNPLDPRFNDQERVSGFGERQTDTTQKMKEGVEETTSKAKEKANQWMNTASRTVDRQRENASAGLDRVASTVHEKADRVPGGPRAVNAAHRFADGMEATASYLREHDLGDIRNDFVNFCRRYPAQTLISAAAVGFLLGRAVRR